MKRNVMARVSVSLLLAALLAASGASSACGLEPVLNGGFTVSHPGSIEVAVAVAKARHDGFLSPASKHPISNTRLLQKMLTDLEKLRARLVKARGATESFSVVLVGPGLWSNFHTSGKSILGRYHVTGPLPGKTTVLTHHAVLIALIKGDLDIDKAKELGLITYSGGDADAIRGAFESGFASSRQSTSSV